MLLRRSLFVFLLAPLALYAGENATITRLKNDLAYLAGDECEGRGPGTKGIELAADHIANIFKEAGLKGAMPDGSYFQPFEIPGQIKVLPTTSLSFGGPEASVAPKLNLGFVPLRMGSDGKVSSEIVFVGFGITAPDLNYDDYAGVDVEGKIVLMLRRMPRYGVTEPKKKAEDKKEDDKATAKEEQPNTNAAATNPPMKPFATEDAHQKMAGIQEKLENAQAHKAAAVILVNDETSITEFEEDNITNLSSLRGSIKIPAVHVKRNLVSSLIRASFNKSLRDIEEEINANLKPQSKVLAKCTGELEVATDRNPTRVKNVVGVLPGAGPLADETVVIGAHYDHLGYGGSGSLARGSKAIHHGADDNGSGTTAILELVRRFGAMNDRQGRRLVFITFSAEEVGLNGSAHYCKEPLFPLEKTVAMINLDMVGRMQPDKETQKGKLEIGGTGTAKQFEPVIDKLSEKYDFKLRKTATGMGPSDHQSFFMKNLPVLFFFTGLHADYHRPTDTFDKVNYEGMSKVVDLVEEIAKEVLVMDPKPEFVKVATPFNKSGLTSSTRGGGPRLGVMPDYAFEGEGMKLQGVSPGAAAEKVGIKEGDRIVEIDGNLVKNVESYMGAMAKVKPGAKLNIAVIRVVDGKDDRVSFTIGLDSRIGVTLDYSAQGQGVLVRGVSGPAEKAGMKEGDRIVDVGGDAVKDAETYVKATRKAKAGEKLEIAVLRTENGKEERVTIAMTLE